MPGHSSRGTLVALATAVTVACASAGGTAGERGSDRELITAEELQETNHRSVLEVVRSLRPQWLRQRPAAITAQRAQTADLVVYLDNTPLGGVDALAGMDPNSVAAVRFFSPSAAQMRFGEGHLNGVIQVISRSSP